MPTAARQHYFASRSSAHDRPPVLLIHGAGGNHLHWPPQVRRVSEQRTFAMDLPGHGQSDGIGRDRIEDYVDDVLAFMAAVGLNSAVWIGHSMGGAIALCAAVLQPRRVLGLGLIASGARMRVDPTLLGHASREAAFPEALRLIGERSFSPASDPRLRDLALQRMAETRSTVLLGDLMACNEFDVTSRLRLIRVPTLVVCGADDLIMPKRHSDLLHAGISGSELVVIRDAGHMVMLEKPEETAHALGRMVSTIEYKPGTSRD